MTDAGAVGGAVGVGIPEFEADVDAEDPDSPKTRRESLKLPPLLWQPPLYLQLLLLLFAVVQASAVPDPVATCCFLSSFVLYSSRRVELRERLFRLAAAPMMPCSMIACSSALPRPLRRLESGGLEVGGGVGVEVELLFRLVNLVVFCNGFEFRSSVADAERVAMLKVWLEEEVAETEEATGDEPLPKAVGIAETSR